MPSMDNGNLGITIPMPPATDSNGSNTSKREVDNNAQSDGQERKRRRKSRWASDDSDKTFIPGMPAVIPPTLSREQEEAYVLQLQIEEVSRKLRTGDFGIPANPEERSPSPEPIYGFDGKRMNTREYRTRKKLEEERHQLIGRMMKINPEFKPPADYKPPLTRVSDKVMIPQDVHPDINFVGLLIGPRGNTLKSMEQETGAKIIIRGKGSVKEGKVGRKDGQPLPGENEPLHAYVTANNPEYVKKAVERIKEIIRQGVEVPEGQNDLRRQQLRELALLNGTLRENDGMRCTNCGATDHKSWTCPDKPNVTMQVICTVCGGAGHIAKDCRQKKINFGSMMSVGSYQEKAKIDEEYMSLMAELGEGPPPIRDNSNYDRNRSSSGGLFDRPMAPRAIAAPPPPPPVHLPNSGTVIPGSLPPPPWSSQTSKLPSPNVNMPPPLPESTATTTSSSSVPSLWQSQMGPPSNPYYSGGMSNHYDSGRQYWGHGKRSNYSSSYSKMSWQSPNMGPSQWHQPPRLPSNLPPSLLTAPPPPPPPPCT